MSDPNRKPVFTAIAICDRDVTSGHPRNKLRMHSAAHWQQNVDKLVPGQEYAVTVQDNKTSRSQQQLAYYWVLLGYLATSCGYTADELHDAIMRQKFGTVHVRLEGIDQQVRKSIANKARFPKADMVELIDETLKLCTKMGVKVPTKEELGYL